MSERAARRYPLTAPRVRPSDDEALEEEEEDDDRNRGEHDARAERPPLLRVLVLDEAVEPDGSVYLSVVCRSVLAMMNSLIEAM